jgi:ATP-binding cassette subfamily B protein
MAGAERIFQLLDETELEEDRGTIARVPEAAAGEAALAFEGVDFAYKKGHPTLTDVSFRIQEGEKIAIVGPTGAGKTTVTSLLLRMYEHQEGVVRVRGQDIEALTRNALRNLFSVVPQDVFLFSGTVLSNIAMGDANPDLERAREALRRMGALELFERREGGLHAKVDERGGNFSGGERQLISFARALYKDAPFLILDEATASIDSDTEARLQTALDAVMQGRTSIVIAHRLSTIRAADRILVFQRGRLVEQGTHDELLDLDGVYARLYRLQYAQPEAVSLPAPPPM